MSLRSFLICFGSIWGSFLAPLRGAILSENIRDFKEEKDFYDVTLACEDKQVEAHKIIISACSPFFKNILKKHKVLNTRNIINMAYSEKVIEHYERPRNIGSLDTRDNSVGTGLVGAPECGDVMKLQIQVDDDNKIVDAKFKTFGLKDFQPCS